MIRRLTAPLAMALIALVVVSGAPAVARADATVDASTVENQYPRNLAFKLTATAPANITGVSLQYSIKGKGSSAVAEPDQFAPAKTISVTVNVPTNTGQSYIPPGSDFTFHWEIVTADGTTTVTKDEAYRFLPTGHIWSSVSSDFMTVLYYGDRKTIADSYLAAGVQTYDKIGKQLLNTQLKTVPVKVLLFAEEAELERAKPGSGGAYDAAVLTCGTKVTDDIVFVIPQACGSNDPTDTLRHEFGHILNGVAGEGALAKLPSWLDEGTAVYAQSTPGKGYSDAFLTAVRNNRYLPFNQMGVITNDATKVNLFYGQSYYMVRYLVEKLGPAKYAEFFATIKAGSRFDQAMQKIYGFDLAGFEQEFTAARGGTQAAPAAAPSATAAAPTQAPRQAATPTRVPTKAPAAAVAAANNSGGDDDKSIGKDTIAIIGAAVVFLLLAVFALLFSMMLRPKPGSGSPPAGPAA